MGSFFSYKFEVQGEHEKEKTKIDIYGGWCDGEVTSGYIRRNPEKEK